MLPANAPARPRRYTWTATLLAVVLAVSAAVAAPSATAHETTDHWRPDLEADLIRATNDTRREQGLSTLIVEEGGVEQTRSWAPEVKAYRDSHDGKFRDEDEGTSAHAPGEHMWASFTCPPGEYPTVGENIGYHGPWDGPFANGPSMHQAYMDSDGHRANILDDRWSYISVGIWEAPDGIVYSVVRFATCGSGGGGTGGTDPIYTQGLVQESLYASGETFEDDGAAYAVLSTTNTFADALGAAGLAGVHGPILFTRGASPENPDVALSDGVLAEIRRILKPGETIYILGGPNAVSMRVDDELRADGWAVTRFAGDTRYDTAVMVADEIKDRFGLRHRRAVVVNGNAWIDALSVGNWAAVTNTPILLTATSSVPAVTQRWLDHNADTVHAIGGQAVIGDAPVRAMGATRISGEDRAATATAVASQLWERTAAQHLDQYLLVDGYADDTWGRALAWSAWSARHQAPMMVSKPDRLAENTVAYLDGLGYESSTQGTYRGVGKLDNDARRQMRELLGLA